MRHYTFARFLTFFASLALSNEAVSSFADSQPLEPQPRAHTAWYNAKITKGISLSGEAIRSLKQKSNGDWEYTSIVKSTPVDIVESTRFAWVEQRIQPKRYDYSRTGFLIKDKRRTIAFKWGKRQAKGRHANDSWVIDILPGYQDKLSYQLQLALDTAQQRPSLEYNTVHKGRVEHSEFSIIGEELLSTAIGDEPSIVIEKIRKTGKKRYSRLWLSKRFPYLLLRMLRREKDGETYEIHIKRFTHDKHDTPSQAKTGAQKE